MAELIRIVLVKDEWSSLLKTLSSPETKRMLAEVGQETGIVTSRLLKEAAQLKGWRSAKDIKSKRKGLRTNVFVPLKLILQDRMEPHYVSLKRGRKIVSWTKKHMPLRRKTGRSRVFTGPRGGIKGGWLYVTPTEWIDSPLKRGLKQTNRIMNKHMRRFLRKAKRR